MASSNEVGRIGQKRDHGVFSEEFLPGLRGKKGIEVYKEMSDNDDVVGAIMFALEMLIRQSPWRVEPGGPEEIDNEAAEFVETCIHDMTDTWTDTLSEILTFLTYGWSYHEIVYKRRMGKTKNPQTNSKYDDGLIGWMKLPIRAQDTLYEWEYDDEDNLLGMTQQPPPTYRKYTIPIEKAMLFRTKSRKGNPEGRSILRNAYRSWYFKKRIQEYEGIGIERDLAGLPVFTAPEGVNIWDDEDTELQKLNAQMEKMVQGIRQDEIAGIVKPAGFEFELLSSSGSKQFDTNTVINRYDTRIAMTVLADFLMLGHQQVGSFALSSDKTDLFATAIGAYLDIICETFNKQGIPRLIDINGEKFAGITDYPKLSHGDIEDVDIAKMGDFLSKMCGIGLLMPDDELEDYVREIGHLPERTGTDTRQIDQTRTDEMNQQYAEARQANEPTEEDKIKEELQSQEAKKRLGRG